MLTGVFSTTAKLNKRPCLHGHVIDSFARGWPLVVLNQAVSAGINAVSTSRVVGLVFSITRCFHRRSPCAPCMSFLAYSQQQKDASLFPESRVRPWVVDNDTERLVSIFSRLVLSFIVSIAMPVYTLFC